MTLHDEADGLLTYLRVRQGLVEAIVRQARRVFAHDRWYPQICRPCVEADGEVLARVAEGDAPIIYVRKQ